jgi:hypothetical protein
MENNLLGIARKAMSVVKQADRLLAGPSIEKARQAVIDAERRQTLRRVLDELEEIPDEFTHEIGGVQVPATFPG